MTDEGDRLRLQFLSRVVEKQCRHLKTTAGKLFTRPFTIESAAMLETDDDLSETTEAFTSRFSRLQDTLGDKLIPYLLSQLGEQEATFVDNLDKAEKLGWVGDADNWMEMRKLRNQMVHEYIEDLNILTDALNSANIWLPEMLKTAENLNKEMAGRGFLES